MNNFIVKPNKTVAELIDIANKPVLYNHYKGEVCQDEKGDPMPDHVYDKITAGTASIFRDEIIKTERVTFWHPGFRGVNRYVKPD